MSRYQVDIVAGPDGLFGGYQVSHYVTGDPQPTPTQTTHQQRPEAWKDALGRAAKLCIIQKSHGLEYCDVQVDDGRIYRVRVEQVR